MEHPKKITWQTHWKSMVIPGKPIVRSMEYPCHFYGHTQNTPEEIPSIDHGKYIAIGPDDVRHRYTVKSIVTNAKHPLE